MLTLAPGSCCDVCAEEYGPQCLPHSIPCGHVMCASCCSTIAEKTPPRQLSPVCPFCREHFKPDTARLIRTDFSSSGWNTPRRIPPFVENLADSASVLWARKAERFLNTDNGCSRSREEEARRLEDRVAKVAHKKCSVEEVSSLHQDLEEWLTSVKSGDQNSSLFLSAALLRAILMNHVAHSEASKQAKSTEASLKGKLDDMELANSKLEAELRRQVSQLTRGAILANVNFQRVSLSQKAQECQTLRTELTRLKVVATTLGGPLPPSSVNERATSPPPPAVYAPSTPSRLNPVHTRTTSLHSRPSTPATPSARSHTPGPTTVRSHTPTPTTRSHTSMGMRAQTPAPLSHRSQTPAPPLPTNNSRRLSESAPLPQKLVRSLSEEKQEVHERWIPPFLSGDPFNSKYSPSKYPSLARAMSTSAAARASSP